MKAKHSGAAGAAILLLAVAGCGGGGSSGLVGAGSTLVAPLVAQWQRPYAKAHGVTIAYGGVGSGGGIEQLSAHVVDFGASDAPLTPGQKSGCEDCVMIPWALAATTIAYHVPGVSKPLRLTGPVLAGMYLGAIRTWSDPRIARLNPGVRLPAIAVHPVYRSDASGDTYAFSDYLARVSPTWRSKVGGASTGISWPTGVGARGNPEVAAEIAATTGAVGYLAVDQAIAAKLPYAELRNRAGSWVEPSISTTRAAAATARFRPDNSALIVDPPRSARTAYPLSTFTYAVVRTSSPKLAALKSFLLYAVTAGQRYATPLHFAPLPPNVVARDKAVIAGL